MMIMQIVSAALLLGLGFWAGSVFTRAPQTQATFLKPVFKTEGAARPKSIRSPASIATPHTPAASDPIAGQPVDLAAFLQNFNIADVHEACDFVHNRFIDHAVTSNAPFVGALENHADHHAYLEGLGVRLAVGEKYWLGRGELDIDGEKASLQVVLDSHDFLPARDADNTNSCFRAQLTLTFASQPPLITGLDACTDSLVTKNQVYYLNWESFGDLSIGRKLAVVQIPLPESPSTAVEVMRTNDHAWTLAPGFSWEAIPLERGLELMEEADRKSSDAVARAE